MKIFVRVNPKAKEEKIEKIDEMNFNVSVKESLEKKGVNEAVARALAAYFSIDLSQVEILSGSASRLKIIEIKK
jgi:uncharacterized protein YggU (UPF0235/DUF167 family)